MKNIREDKYGWPTEAKALSEDVSEFGLPDVEVQAEDATVDEAKRINYKGLLEELMSAVETHMQVMSGTAEEGTEDPLEMVMMATKEALEPPKEGGEGSKGSKDAMPPESATTDAE